MAEGYHDYERWDIRGTIRRGAFYLTKGVEEKENIIQSTDRLLVLIDEEEAPKRTFTYRT